MNPRNAAAIVTTLLSCMLASQATAAGFVDQPAVHKDGANFVVSFSVDEATDVAVTVRNEVGKIVRHLAAGRLGPNAPAPLKAGSLKQRVTWDGADDAGRAVQPGNYRIEVSLGLAVKFDKTLGDDTRAIDEIHGLGVGPTGQLYVMSATGRDNFDGRFQIFDEYGGYIRTIMPRSGDLPADRVKPFNDIVLADGSRVPRTMLPFYEWRALQQPVVLPDGDLVFVNARMRSEVSNGARYANRLLGPEGRQKPFERRLLRLADDGGAPRKASFVGPLLGTNMDGEVCLAASPDGQTIYLSGSRHAIFATTWKENGPLTLLIGTPDTPGDGQAALRDPAGIDTDAAGNIYVADRGNHRIAMFDAKGKFLRQMKVEWPDFVRVAPGGAAYVVAGFKERQLLKFDKFDDDKPAASLPLGLGRPFLAFYKDANATALFVANVNADRIGRGGRLVRIEDRDGKLKITVVIGETGRLIQPFMIGVDRQRELAYAKRGIYSQYIRFDGRTGKAEEFRLPLNAKSNGIFEASAAPDGTVVGHVAHEFAKMDSLLRPVPFGALGSYLAYYANEDGPRSHLAKDCTIAPSGDIYWLHEFGGYAKPMLCSVLDRDGRERTSGLITFDDCSAAGVRVDRQGFIYTLNHLKPVGKLVPDELAGKTGTNRQDQHVYKYGSVLKWKPTGGRVKLVAPGQVQKRDVPAGSFQLTTAEGRGDFQTEGVEWVHFGVSNILPNFQRDGCHCWTPRFDLDDYGRLFLPDQALNRVVVLDGNGNVLATFGRYGNIDDTKGKRTDVPFGDPRTVMVSDEAAYIGDQSNNCIVRAKLEYYVTASADAAVAGKPGELAKSLEPIRAGLIKAVPAAEQAIDWAAISQSLPANASAPDAAMAVALATRQAKLTDADRAKLLAAIAVDESSVARAAAILAQWDRTDKPSIELLTAALKDKDQMVRVLAADTLLTMNNPAGLVEIFTGLTSDDMNLYRLAETAFTRKVLDGENSRYPIGKPEAEALGNLLDRTNLTDRKKAGRYWYMRSTAIKLLGTSGQQVAIQPLLSAMRHDSEQYGGKRNMCRCIDALGRLRARQAGPELLKFLARGTIETDNSNFGDTAERNAADALAAIGDPATVAPLIDLLASDRKNTASLALRALSSMFSAEPVPADRALLPKDSSLVSVRIDELPAKAEINKAWQAFWSTNNAKYEYNPDAALLKHK